MADECIEAENNFVEAENNFVISTFLFFIYVYNIYMDTNIIYGTGEELSIHEEPLILQREQMMSLDL